MTDWQQRVVEEYQQLEEKINKLSSFLENATVEDTTPHALTLLHIQFSVMLTYSNILRARISLFN